MLNKLVEFSIQNRWWVILVFLSVGLLGVYSATHLPIDAVPDISNVQVVINTKTAALEPGKIEKLVTYPIEMEMAGLQGVEEVRSLSKYGLSQVTVIFEDHTDVYFARQLINEKLQHIRSVIPAGLAPEMAPVTTGLGEVLMYVLEAKQGSELAKLPEKERLIYLREVQDYTVRPSLKKIPGVADVDTNGGYLKQVHINVFPQKLERYGISIEHLISKLESIGESFSGGYIQSNGQQIIVRGTGQLSNIDTIANFPIALDVSGNPVRVRDVANVAIESALRVGAATAHGYETVLGTVLMRTGANSREVSQRAELAIQNEIRLPDDVQIKVLYSRGHLVNETIHTILKNLLEGAALVILVLLLLLGNFRAALIVASAIPLSMLFALNGMAFLGISANLMSLGAIDFGLLVDGAVVLIENVIRRRSRVLEASQEVVRPLTFGLLIIMLVYVPILFLEGIEGKMFKPMAATVLLALVSSLLIAVFLMPALASIFLRNLKPEMKEPWLFRVIHKSFEPSLQFALKRPWVAGVLGFVPTVVAVPIFLNLGSDFVPSLKEGDVVVNLTRDTRQDIDTSVSWQKRAENLIAKFPEVESVFSRMGTPESALDPMGPYLADTFVILKKHYAGRSAEELQEAIRVELMKDNPNQEVSFTQPIEMRFNEMLEGSRADVSLRIYGPDLDKLLELTQQAKQAISSIHGVDELAFDPLTALTKSPVLDVELDYEKLAKYGVPLKDVSGILEASMGGRSVGSFFSHDRRFPVVVHLDESLRNNIVEISRVPVGLASGGTIPLSYVTDVKQYDQVTTVARSAGKRYSALAIYLKNRDIAGFVAEAKQRVEQEVKLSSGYEFSWGGQFKNLKKAQQRLAIIIPIVLLAIFLFLLRNFGNFRHAALVFSAIPLAMSGGVFSLYLRNIHFSISAAVGFIVLAGIATLNSVVLVGYFNQLRSQGVSVGETVFQGALTRLRPVSMTALVASLGFLPMALNTGAGAEVQRPLATVVIGGLITSTVLTLIVVPVLYAWLEQRFARNA